TKSIGKSHLDKRHGRVVVPAREASRSCVTAVPRHAPAKLAIRQEAQQLREDGSTLVHQPLSPSPKSCLEGRPAQIAASRNPAQLSAMKGPFSWLSAVSRTPMNRNL